MKSRIIFFLFLFIYSKCEEEFPIEKDVIVLTDSTFDKAINKYAHFSKESSVNQQNAYLKMADEVEAKHGDTIKVFKVDTGVGLEETKKRILEILS